MIYTASSGATLLTKPKTLYVVSQRFRSLCFFFFFFVFLLLLFFYIVSTYYHHSLVILSRRRLFQTCLREIA